MTDARSSSMPDYIKRIVTRTIPDHRRPNGDVDIRSIVYAVASVMSPRQRFEFFGVEPGHSIGSVKDQEHVKAQLLAIDDEICRQLGIPAFDKRN